jgi:hypothetical protein
MLKVHILVHCEFCDGEAHVFVGEAVDNDGRIYPRHGA